MTPRLHLVFGGELKDQATNVFKTVDDLRPVGICSDHKGACNASPTTEPG